MSEPEKTSISAQLNSLNGRIQQACEGSGRDRQSVTLIGVSKTKPVTDIAEAHRLGLTHFGENYLQEAASKIEELRRLNVQWHYIGTIQSNKTKDVAKHFDWVHTVDRLKIGQRLSSQCPTDKMLKVLIQVNIDADPNKSGCLASQVPSLVYELMQLPQLEVRGLMTILSRSSDPRASYESVAQLHRDVGSGLSMERLQKWDTLSMGMTADMEHAIAAGATHIRIGTALFGGRA